MAAPLTGYQVLPIAIGIEIEIGFTRTAADAVTNHKLPVVPTARVASCIARQLELDVSGFKQLIE